MAIVNSKEKVLPTYQVILQALTNAKREKLLKDVPVEVALAAMIREGTLPNAEVKQIGNTVFIAHYSKDRAEVYMRALNVDSARNYYDNAMAYADYLSDSGVVRLTSDFNDKRIVQLFKAIANRPGYKHWGMKVYKLSNGGMRAFVVMPKE